MRIDVLSLGDHLPDPLTGKFNGTQADRYHQLVDIAVNAEQGDLGAFWLGEHHASAYIVPSPQMILAAVAMRTKRIRLGTAVSLLPNSDPVRIAEEFAMLDLLSDGRAEIGFGSGVTEHTFRLFGQDPEQAQSLLTENLDLLTRLWSDEKVNWRGKHRAPIEHTRIEPRNFLGKSIPITRAVGGSLDTVRDVARRGYKIALATIFGGFSASRELVQIYRDEYRAAGHDPNNMRVAASVYVYTEVDGSSARAHWEPYRDNYFRFGADLFKEKGTSRSIKQRMDQYGEKLMVAAAESQMCGEPAELVDRILKAYDDVGGFDELMCLFDIGGMSPSDTLKSMDLFIDKVKPHLMAI